MPKQAENYFRDMVNAFPTFHARKYGDARYCIHCHKILPKTEHAPDFGIGSPWTWVECKNNPKSSARWMWTEIAKGGERENQRNFLLEHGGWLFIVLGTGRLPKGKSGFLIRFHDWVHSIEPELLLANQKSIRKTGGRGIIADDILAPFKLNWVDGRFFPPNHHCFWQAYRTALEKQLVWVKEIING